jgi:two-component system sensor histidine kinase TorS
MFELFEGKRFYLIDDNPTDLAVFFTLLEKLGAVVYRDPYTLGTIGALASNLPIDMIFLDLTLRRQISGYRVFEMLREIPAFDQIPIVCVSSADPETEIPKAMEMGFAGFLHKPFNRAVFFDHLYTCLNGGHVWDAGQSYFNPS